MKTVFSNVGIYDLVIIQESIKRIRQTKQINGTEKHHSKMKNFNQFYKMYDLFLFIVIFIIEVDKRDAQHGLRRIIEKYIGSC